MSMYFDHARCPSCGAAFDPDKITVRDGNPACPHCGAVMKLVDMFGIADAFAEDDAPEMTLDDLVPGEYEEGDLGGRVGLGGGPGARPSSSAFSGARTHKVVTREDKARMTESATPSSPNLPAARRPVAGAGAVSAADVMKELKSSKKK